MKKEKVLPLTILLAHFALAVPIVVIPLLVSDAPHSATFWSRITFGLALNSLLWLSTFYFVSAPFRGSLPSVAFSAAISSLIVFGILASGSLLLLSLFFGPDAVKWFSALQVLVWSVTLVLLFLLLLNWNINERLSQSSRGTSDYKQFVPTLAQWQRKLTGLPNAGELEGSLNSLLIAVSQVRAHIEFSLPPNASDMGAKDAIRELFNALSAIENSPTLSKALDEAIKKANFCIESLVKLNQQSNSQPS